MKALRLVLVVCLILAAASCSLKATWDLPGKWQQVEGKDVIEFSQNGTMVYSTGSTAYTLPYKYIDAKELRIDLGIFGTTAVKASLEKDVLTLTDPAGKVVKFAKVK